MNLFLARTDTAVSGRREYIMPNRKQLPVGIEFFQTIREQNYYYVDKTRLIKQLLTSGGYVNLFTRPRRFGKTLNMDMLRCFFEIGGDPSLFNGLAIAEEKELCDTHMGKYPVIFISLKGIASKEYLTARNLLVSIITAEVRRHMYLADSPVLSEDEKKIYQQLNNKEMGDEDLYRSLYSLSELLYKHYKKKVIILIDEYDVPLDKAYHAGYYDEMIVLIRGMLDQALKTNSSLRFAVLTGCLRVSKESIFTGLNNIYVNTVSDVAFDEYFGFTDDEVKTMLSCYGLSDHYRTVREWYDGYRFGNTDVYCPWDVISYCFDLLQNPDALPVTYWANTSGNDIVRKLIHNTRNIVQRREIESLSAGETVQKRIYQQLTYPELETSCT